jgi:GntR family negative regulator for fad regulon and positive regulator of fabA
MREKTIFRPFTFALERLVRGVLDGTYPQGSCLPAERLLAQQLGITRPTLREALQVLAAEGWFHIRHGKASEVAYFLKTGNSALMNRLAAYPEWLPDSLILHLLDVRSGMMPQIAHLAWEKGRQSVLEYLAEIPPMESDSDVWVNYDWNLQVVMLLTAENPVFRMIFNGFGDLFKLLSKKYFTHEKARQSSRTFYTRLAESKTEGEWTGCVQQAMNESRQLWSSLCMVEEEENKA